MAQVSVNKEGVTELKGLAKSLGEINDEIDENGKTLKTVVAALSEKLGIYEDEILELIETVNSKNENGRETVNFLKEKVENLAKDVEELVMLGLSS